MVKQYKALGAAEFDAAAARSRHQAVNWLNRMFTTEPIIAFNKSVMVDFYFT